MSDDKESSKRRLKEGFVKSPRRVEYELFGSNSPLPEKWRVFNFIKYRIQDNKREDQSERISREYIIENTGICASNFNRIINGLVNSDLVEITQGNYRDSVRTYRLSTHRFTYPVIAADTKKKSHVDKSRSHVDKSDTKNGDNFILKSENELKLQNEVVINQNEVETPLTSLKSLAENSSRSLSSRTLINLRAPKKKEANFILLGGGQEQKQKTTAQEFGISEDLFRKVCVEWHHEGCKLPFPDWLKQKGYTNG